VLSNPATLCGGSGGREGKGRGVSVLKGREAGRNVENYATLHNISQSKKGKREEAKKKGAGPGLQGGGGGGLDPPVTPSPLPSMSLKINVTLF